MNVIKSMDVTFRLNTGWRQSHNIGGSTRHRLTRPLSCTHFANIPAIILSITPRLLSSGTHSLADHSFIPLSTAAWGTRAPAHSLLVLCSPTLVHSLSCSESHSLPMHPGQCSIQVPAWLVRAPRRVAFQWQLGGTSHIQQRSISSTSRTPAHTRRATEQRVRTSPTTPAHLYSLPVSCIYSLTHSSPNPLTPSPTLVHSVLLARSPWLPSPLFSPTAFSHAPPGCQAHCFHLLPTSHLAHSPRPVASGFGAVSEWHAALSFASRDCSTALTHVAQLGQCQLVRAVHALRSHSVCTPRSASSK